MILRDYQTEAVNAVERYWREGRGTAPLVVAPTGSGKSIMIAALIARRIVTYREYSPPYRIMLATHVRELVEQDIAAIERYDADLRDRIAIWSASLHKVPDDKASKAIIAGTIQTIARRLKRITEPVDLLVVDEAHLIPTREQSQYRKLIAHLRSLNPNLRMVGFTATPYRLDQGMLHEGSGATFDGIAANVDFAHLIVSGHLVPAKPRWEGRQIDMDSLKVRAGDYTSESQSAAMDLPSMVSDALKSGGGGHGGRWLWFLPSVETAHSAALSLRQSGHRAATVHGAMPTAERDAAIDTFRRGEIGHLTNCALMTTGFDIPEIDRIVLARATRSTALFVQMCGRGLRPSPGKDRCIVLDYGGNVMRHGPVDAPQPSVERRGKGKSKQSVMRQCKKCGAFVLKKERSCPECGYAAPPPRVYFDALNGREIMFEGETPDNVYPVESWSVVPWNVDVPGRNPCVKVLYVTRREGRREGRRSLSYNKWYFPRNNGHQWQRSEFLRTWHRFSDGPCPIDVHRAVEGMRAHWPCPDMIKVEKTAGPFPKITPIYKKETE